MSRSAYRTFAVAHSRLIWRTYAHGDRRPTTTATSALGLTRLRMTLRFSMDLSERWTLTRMMAHGIGSFPWIEDRKLGGPTATARWQRRGPVRSRDEPERPPNNAICGAPTAHDAAPVLWARRPDARCTRSPHARRSIKQARTSGRGTRVALRRLRDLRAGRRVGARRTIGRSSQDVEDCSLWAIGDGYDDIMHLLLTLE